MSFDFEDSITTTHWLEFLPYHPIFNSEKLEETPKDCKRFVLNVFI